MSIKGWFPNVHQLMDINFHFLNYYIFYLFIFNWRIIALQYCIGFCHTSTWKSLVYVRPLPLESPSHLPPHPTPLGCHRAPGLSSLFRFFFLLLQTMLLYVSVYKFLCGYIFISWVYKSRIAGLYVNIWRNCQAVFQSGCCIVHSH